MKRIGLLTSGGDCQALNATMRGVVKGLSTNLIWKNWKFTDLMTATKD